MVHILCGYNQDTQFFNSHLTGMVFVEPAYSVEEVNKAGRSLVEPPLLGDMDEEFEILNNWRASHGYPLQCIKMLLRGRALNVDNDAIVAQRLKRLPSIRNKLARETTMKLSQMHDIGGCRAVVKSMPKLNNLCSKFEVGVAKNPTGRHVQQRIYNYITNPKRDGYRSIHYRYMYKSTSPQYANFDGHKIEIQIRTRLQHWWATAVETTDMFTGQNLKSSLKTNIGDPHWKRFFALASNAIAMRERTELIPDMPGTAAATKKELKTLVRDLHVTEILDGLHSAVGDLAAEPLPLAKTYILTLNSKEKTVSITGFKRKDLPFAERQYLELEKKYENTPEINVVKVSVDNISQLRNAYPNYYLDSRYFVRFLESVLK